MKPLSPNNIVNVLLFPVLLLLIMPLFMLAGLAGVSNPVVAIILYTLLIIWIIVGAKETYNLHYDEEFLYLRSIADRKKNTLIRNRKNSTCK